MVEAADMSDPCAGMNRAQIKDYCIQKGESHLAAKEGYEVQTDNPSKCLKIWMTEENGVAMSVSENYAEGLSMEDFRAFYAPDAWPTNITLLDKEVTAQKLDEDTGLDDCYLMYQYVKTPMVVADRCLFQSVYNVDLPNGDMIFVQTSYGNALVEQ